MGISSAHPTPAPIRVDIWTDVVCPWCYIGKRRFEKARALFDGTVEVRYRSFELDSRPRSLDRTLPEMLAAKYGVSLDQAMAMNRRVTEVAASEGLDYHLELARPTNTFDAHRLIHHAASVGLQEPMVERLKAAYFSEGQPIDDPATLARLGGEVGLDATEVEAMLASGRFSDEVRADQALAAELDIHGVPFFVIDRRYGISGAQDPTLIARVLTRTRDELAAAQPS
jgi:predicted DsbA family dithiol-disulfide isomerase